MSVSSQLPLDLSHAAAVTREDLIESPANATAIAMVDAWPEWPGRVMALVGPEGSGKSHIAAAWLDEAGGFSCRASAISEHEQELRVAFEEGKSVVLEDARPGEIDEIALFHLINSVNQADVFCLITSRFSLPDWKVELPDLKSRMRAMQMVNIHEPDDLLLGQVMVKLFADRQIMIDERTVAYCVRRMERSLAAAVRLVAAIDAEALARKMPVNRTIAASVLQDLQNAGNSGN